MVQLDILPKFYNLKFVELFVVAHDLEYHLKMVEQLKIVMSCWYIYIELRLSHTLSLFSLKRVEPACECVCAWESECEGLLWAGGVAVLFTGGRLPRDCPLPRPHSSLYFTTGILNQSRDFFCFRYRLLLVSFLYLIILIIVTEYKSIGQM